jgi:hypothetical protein
LAADPRSPGVVYASHEDGSHVDATLSRSLDGGATWTPLLHTEMGGVILVDPADSNRIEYGTARGVWSSIDGGSSWQGPTGPETYALAAAGGTVYAGAWMRISASRDRESWTELPLPESDDRNPAVTAIGVDPSDPERIFAGTAGGHLWMTADGGASWTLAWSRRDYGPTSIVVDPHDGSTVHVGTTYMGPSPMGLFQDGAVPSLRRRRNQLGRVVAAFGRTRGRLRRPDRRPAVELPLRGQQRRSLPIGRSGVSRGRASVSNSA